MKILVPVKRVLDFNVKPQVRADGSGVELANVKMSMNPFDEIALEQAIRLKEAGIASEVLALSIGPAQARDTLRAALAVGADRALLLESASPVEPLAVAKLVAAVAKAEGSDLVILGKQAIDDDMGAVGPMLGGLLGWPQATFASKVDVADGALVVVRETDSGLQVLRLSLPAIVTADLRLNTPRYATLPNIMKAKSKPLAEKTAAEFGVDLTPRLEIVTTRAPAPRKAGARVGSVAELVDRLRNEAGVL